MCGRHAVADNLDELIQMFVARGGDARDWEPAYSIPPRTRVPMSYPLDAVKMSRN